MDICARDKVAVFARIGFFLELERWRRGEERMWVADGSVALWVVPDDIHGMTDDEAEALGLEIY